MQVRKQSLWYFSNQTMQGVVRCQNTSPLVSLGPKMMTVGQASSHKEISEAQERTEVFCSLFGFDFVNVKQEIFKG